MSLLTSGLSVGEQAAIHAKGGLWGRQIYGAAVWGSVVGVGINGGGGDELHALIVVMYSFTRDRAKQCTGAIWTILWGNPFTMVLFPSRTFMYSFLCVAGSVRRWQRRINSCNSFVVQVLINLFILPWLIYLDSKIIAVGLNQYKLLAFHSCAVL